jgi:hypothetical protein
MLILKGDLNEFLAGDFFPLGHMLRDEMAKSGTDRQTSLHIEELVLGEYMASELLQFFRDCSRTSGLKMDKFVIKYCEFNLYLVSILYEVLSLDLFQEIDLSGQGEEDLSLGLLQALRKSPIESPIERLRTYRLTDLEVTAAHILVLSDIFTSATKLESLSFMYCEIQRDEAGTTLETILGFTRNLKIFSLQFTCLDDATLSRMIESVAVNNPLLEELNFNGSYCGDLSLRSIANCLQHKNFSRLSLGDLDGNHHIGTHLQLKGDPHARDFGVIANAIHQLNGDPHARDFSVIANAIHNGCPLQEVAICCKIPTAEFESLLSVLLRCPSVERLVLSTLQTSSLNFETIDVDALARDVRDTSSLRNISLCSTRLCKHEPLFRILSQCPKLEELYLPVTGLERLDIGTTLAKPSLCRLRVFDLGDIFDEICLGNDELEHVILEILQANPLLYDLCCDNDGELLHAMDMNWAGRVLIGNDKCPRSLWSTVIERVNHNRWWTPDRRASAIFGLLRHSDIAHDVSPNGTIVYS